ncbi:MAG: hypothetical protein HZB23_15995 [Deltaproteobacteria bacterium]|nr:hypothetical protein [Deltaproteobacteria bacterium]
MKRTLLIFALTAVLAASFGCDRAASFKSITGDYAVDIVKSLEIIKTTDRYKALPREKQAEVEAMFSSVVKSSRLNLAENKLTVVVEGRQVEIPITSVKKTENGFEITSKIEPPPNAAKAPGAPAPAPRILNLGIKVDEDRIQFFMAGNPGLSQHIWKKTS